MDLPKKEERELLHLEIESKTMQIVGAIISNLLVEVENFEQMVQANKFADLENLLNRLTDRNDALIETFNSVLQDGIFLPYDESFFHSLSRSISSLIDSVEAFGHRIDLHPLPQWVLKHLGEMLKFLENLLQEVFEWTEFNKEPNLKKIQQFENSADDSHRTFMKELYSSELEFKQFLLSKDLNELLEHSIDLAERMAENVILMLKITEISERDPPTYLS